MKRYIYVLALILLGMNLNAQSVWDGRREAIKKGSGTITDPYLIENAQNFAWLVYLINYDYGKWTDEKYFLLTTDIDLNGNENNQWIPIGAGSSMNKCKNINIYFDGDNHSITGLYIDNNAEIANEAGIWSNSNAALFNISCNGNKGYIKNLHVEGNIHIDDLACAGITGNNGSIIENCVTNVDIETNSGAGGIAYNGGTIKNCYNFGDITGETTTGGITGTYPTMEIVNCYNTGNITGNGQTGGIAGTTMNTSITNCYNTGDITGNGIIGGITGICAKSHVINCYNVGTVKATEEAESIGAIIGKKQSNTKIENTHYLNTCIESSNEFGEAQNADFMRSMEFVNMLNNNTDVWSMDENNINNGYPILTSITFTVGVEEFIDKNNMVSFFPNPANDYVNIEGDITYYQIFDITGNVVATNNTSSESRTINVSDYTPGIYFVRCITQNGSIITKKIIIR